MNILEKLANEYTQESIVMLRCADANPRETGGSYYAQRAVQCSRIADTLRLVAKEKHHALEAQRREGQDEKSNHAGSEEGVEQHR